MAQYEIHELAAKQSKIAAYAKEIAKTIKERDSIHEELNSIPMDDCDNWLDTYARMGKKELSITMKIRHFYDMIYGKGNIFNEPNKGNGYLEYLWDFQTSARIYGARI